MDDDLNKSLPVDEIVKKAYSNVRDNLKYILILSYIVMIPVFFASRLLNLGSFEENNINIAGILLYLCVSIAVLLFLNVFSYRLFVLGREKLYKININQLLSMLGKLLLYYIALFAVLFLAVVTLALLMGLIVMIVQAVSGLNTQNNPITTTIFSSFILIFVLLISLRVQPTFISIALNRKAIPMKTSYYYTRDNNMNLLIIGFASYFPVALLSSLLSTAIVTLEKSAPGAEYLMVLILPLFMLPNILIFSAGAEIFKYLVPKDQNHKVDISA